MAYIAVSHGCCHCQECWNIADVPHGFERHVIQGGFATKAAAEAAFKKETA